MHGGLGLVDVCGFDLGWRIIIEEIVSTEICHVIILHSYNVITK